MTKIFITNLGKYNEGELIGEWVTLPVDDEELDEVLNHIGINEQYEEYFITDYETDVEGFEIGEYDNINYLNEIAEATEDLADYEQTILSALLTEGYDFNDAIEKISDCMIYYDCQSMEDVAREYAAETGLLNDIPESLQCYFDFESFGRDMSFDGQFVFIGNDCVEII